jgi:DNA-binding transcriptional LysR family regulator
MDKFEDLQAFVAVVEAGTFTAAADRLNTAKSAVSRRVSALEERWVSSYCGAPLAH